MNALGKLAVPAFLASALLAPVHAASTNSLRVAMPTVPLRTHVMLTRSAARHLRPGTGNLIYHGGPVLLTPAVYVTYWGWKVDPSGERAYLENFLGGVGGSPWMNIVTQYSSRQGYIANPVGQLAGTWSDVGSFPLPAHPTDGQIRAEAERAIDHFGLNANGSYVIATPTGHFTDGFGAEWCAYHGWTGRASYTNLPYTTDAGTNCGANIISSRLDGVSIIEGHEYAESQTDAAMNAWYDVNGFEVADLCSWQNISLITLSTGSFAVQSLWSNASSSCVLGY